MGTIKLEALNHVGVRVRDLDRSAQWYAHFGFRLIWQSEQHKVACLRNDEIGVELNLIFNSNDSHDGKNVLMDIAPKYPGFNHLSFRVPSIQDTIEVLNAAGDRDQGRPGVARRRNRGVCSRSRPERRRVGRDHRSTRHSSLILNDFLRSPASPSKGVSAFSTRCQFSA